MAQAAGAPSASVPEEPPPPLPHSSSSSSSSSSGDSGHVSQSHSSASGIGDEQSAQSYALGGEFLLAAAAADYASYLLPSPFENVASAGQASEWSGGAFFAGRAGFERQPALKPLARPRPLRPPPRNSLALQTTVVSELPGSFYEAF